MWLTHTVSLWFTTVMQDKEREGECSCIEKHMLEGDGLAEVGKKQEPESKDHVFKKDGQMKQASRLIGCMGGWKEIYRGIA